MALYTLSYYFDDPQENAAADIIVEEVTTDMDEKAADRAQERMEQRTIRLHSKSHGLVVVNTAQIRFCQIERVDAE